MTGAHKTIPVKDYRVAVILPCYNEAITIGQTVEQFQDALPTATVYVYDNNSTDATADVAVQCGAVVGFESHAGKGNVIRRMFADVEADIYVLADGDATYDSDSASDMVAHLIRNNLDMVNGARESTERAAYRRGHQLGNRILTGLVHRLFSRKLEDMLSGYRVFSRRFVKTFPAMSQGFEIETELTIHALQLRMPIDELPTPYKARPKNSTSKLSTYSDGLRILRMIGLLVKEEKPLQFFSTVALFIFVPSFLVFLSVFNEFLATDEVRRFPSLFMALSGFIISSLSIVCAVLLDSISRGRREARHIAYLQYPGLRQWSQSDVLDLISKDMSGGQKIDNHSRSSGGD